VYILQIFLLKTKLLFLLLVKSTRINCSEAMYCKLSVLSALLLVVSSTELNSIPGTDLWAEIIGAEIDRKPANGDSSFQLFPVESLSPIFKGPISSVAGALRSLVSHTLLPSDILDFSKLSVPLTTPLVSLSKPTISLSGPAVSLGSAKPFSLDSVKPAISSNLFNPLALLKTKIPQVSTDLLQPLTLINEKKLTNLITAKIAGPVVLFNSKLAAAAGALPALLAAKGAVIGAAIATPIEIGAVVSSSLASGVTAKLVAIPVSLISKASTKLAIAAKAGKKVVALKALAIKSGAKLAKKGAITLGHMLLKPIAIIAGTKSALAGAGLGIAGSGVKLAGLGLQAAGSKLALSGLKAKGAGALLIGLAFNDNSKHDLLKFSKF